VRESVRGVEGDGEHHITPGKGDHFLSRDLPATACNSRWKQHEIHLEVAREEASCGCSGCVGRCLSAGSLARSGDASDFKRRDDGAARL